jgi:hypothetical protein
MPVLLGGACSLLRAAGRGLPGMQLTFFASPKERKQRKGDPTCCVPSLRYGQPAVLGPDGVSLELATLHFAQTIAIPDPSGPALLGASRRGGSRNTKQPRIETRLPEETRTRHGESLLVFVFGIWSPVPDCPLWMRRGAQVQADQGSRLSEPKASSSETPLEPSTAGCPQRSEGTQQPGSPFLW